MSSNFPLVTIGLPVYNEEKIISRALDSLLAQTYPNFEIIISDNYSTDKTAEICKAYAERDNRIKLNLNKENLGINANFRIVHKKGRGKYFMWAAGDDYWEPEFLKTLVNELESDPMIGVVQCAIRRENPDGSLKDVVRFDEKYNTSRFSHWNVAMKLLSPNRQIKSQKYNLFIHGIFKYKVVNDIFILENDILKYRERTFLAPIALAYKCVFIDKILFSKMVKEDYKIRHPEDELIKTKKEISYLKYWSKCYYKIMLCIMKYKQIPLQRKFFVLFFPYWMCWRFTHKQEKRVKKLFYGKNS